MMCLIQLDLRRHRRPRPHERYFFSSRRRHTRSDRDWSSDVCSSDLENVCRLIAGENIYDPYSGYGPYGRHNREYNRDELAKLLVFAGFEIEVLFSADVHESLAAHFACLEQVEIGRASCRERV